MHEAWGLMAFVAWLGCGQCGWQGSRVHLPAHSTLFLHRAVSGRGARLAHWAWLGKANRFLHVSRAMPWLWPDCSPEQRDS